MSKDLVLTGFRYVSCPSTPLPSYIFDWRKK